MHGVEGLVLGRGEKGGGVKTFIESPVRLCATESARVLLRALHRHLPHFRASRRPCTLPRASLAIGSSAGGCGRAAKWSRMVGTVWNPPTHPMCAHWPVSADTRQGASLVIAPRDAIHKSPLLCALRHSTIAVCTPFFFALFPCCPASTLCPASPLCSSTCQGLSSSRPAGRSGL